MQRSTFDDLLNTTSTIILNLTGETIMYLEFNKISYKKTTFFKTKNVSEWYFVINLA